MTSSARAISVLAAIAASIAISGCFGSSGDHDFKTQSQDPAALRGATFQVTAVRVIGTPKPLVPDTRALIAFTRGGPEILGRAGCSPFFSNGIKITATKIVLPFRIHPVPNHPPKCSRPRQRQDAWLKAFLASDPRWDLSPPQWHLGDEADALLTLTSGNTVVKLREGKLQHLTGIRVSPDSGAAPVTSYSGE
jgi:hypothetical protein